MRRSGPRVTIAVRRFMFWIVTGSMVMAVEPAAAGSAGADFGRPACFRTGVSFMPQMGQLPGLSWMTCGCMPQV